MTSICRPSAIATQGSQAPHGSIVGPPCPSVPMQFNALAINRAVEVFPTPRTPVIKNACARRSRFMALPKVWTIASCPMSSANVCGRYLRAKTRYAAPPVATGAAAGIAATGKSRPSPNASSGISGSRSANSGVSESGIIVMLIWSSTFVEVFSTETRGKVGAE